MTWKLQYKESFPETGGGRWETFGTLRAYT
jgi:hypothetical protein